MRAAPGATAISGQALKLNGVPLKGMRVSVDGNKTKAFSDRTGRFLLKDLEPGHHVLVLDGRRASFAGERYGVFEFVSQLSPAWFWSPFGAWRRAGRSG